MGMGASYTIAMNNDIRLEAPTSHSMIIQHSQKHPEPYELLLLLCSAAVTK
jgi:hypothetical protein